MGSGRGTGETQGATLENANLSNAVLNGADLYYSSFRNADLTHNGGVPTRLEAANLEGALLEYTNLRGVDLWEVRNLTQEQIDQAKGDAPNCRTSFTDPRHV